MWKEQAKLKDEDKEGGREEEREEEGGEGKE